MKKNVLIIFAFMLVFTYGLLVIKKEVFPYELSKYAKNLIVPIDSRKSNLEIHPPSYVTKIGLYKIYMNNNIPKVVMFGDSITNRCNWDELLKREDVINRGIDGDTTYGMLNRLDTVNPESIQKVFIMAGINDIIGNHNAQDVFQRYIKIIGYIKKNNMQPYIQSTLFVSQEVVFYKERNSKVSELNSLLEKFAKENSIEYINLNSKLSKNKLLIDTYSSDGIHLNSKGYIIWKDILKTYI